MLWPQTHATDVWRFKSQAHAMGGRRHKPDGHDAGAASDAGLWRGPSEARWIVQLLHGAPPPRGSALHVDARLALPDQLSVVGFDDIPLAAHVRPALATVHQDATDWGRATARSRVALVEGEPLPAVTLTPVIFVERASASAPQVH
jgi:Transcriptional regulators